MACIRMSLRSRVLDVDTVVNVVIPYDHFDREGRPKPFTRTLYLLHGLRQNADAWQRMSSAERFANYYGYALIMPDAQRSFYTDMAHGPRFFTYLTEELPEIMQAMFKIPADPAHTYAVSYTHPLDDLAARVRTWPKDQKKPLLYLACGTEDPLHPLSTEMNAILQENHFDVCYQEWPGIHDWRFWDVALEKGMIYMKDRLPE